MVNGSVFCKLLMVKHLSLVGAVNCPFKVGANDAWFSNILILNKLQNEVTLTVRAKRSRPEPIATNKPCHRRIWWFNRQNILNSQM